jgi:drug/metabolite transporter (DMT)-like permease
VVVALALAAALCFALASVLQQQAAVAVPSEHSLRFRLLTNLVRRPRWLAGIVIDGCGYVLQVLALDRGPLSLVQPLLAFGLLFALLFNASPGQRGLRKRDWLAAAFTAGGLALFVGAGAPKGAADADIGGSAWALVIVLTAAAVVVAIILGKRRGPAGQAALLAAGAGMAFGLSAALTKQSLGEFHRGAAHLMGTGYPYLLLLAGAAGMVLAQSAFHSGALAASLPTLTLSEPVFAAAAGAALFGEHLRSGWLGALALLGAVVSAVAVVSLARSPRAQPVVAP